MLLFFLRSEILTPLMLSWVLKTWSTIIWVLGWKFKIWYQKQLSLCNVYLWYFDNRYEFIYINFFHEFLEVVCFALKSVTQLNAQYKQLSRWPFFTQLFSIRRVKCSKNPQWCGKVYKQTCIRLFLHYILNVESWLA